MTGGGRHGRRQGGSEVAAPGDDHLVQLEPTGHPMQVGRQVIGDPSSTQPAARTLRLEPGRLHEQRTRDPVGLQVDPGERAGPRPDRAARSSRAPAAPRECRSRSGSGRRTEHECGRGTRPAGRTGSAALIRRRARGSWHPHRGRSDGASPEPAPGSADPPRRARRPLCGTAPRSNGSSRAGRPRCRRRAPVPRSRPARGRRSPRRPHRCGSRRPPPRRAAPAQAGRTERSNWLVRPALASSPARNRYSTAVLVSLQFQPHPVRGAPPTRPRARAAAPARPLLDLGRGERTGRPHMVADGVQQLRLFSGDPAQAGPRLLETPRPSGTAAAGAWRPS